MKVIKQKILVLIGGVSAFLGSVGAVIASFGLCACVLAPAFSFIGISSIIMGFLSNNKMFFLIIGIVFLLLSFLFFKKKKTCKKHKKS